MGQEMFSRDVAPYRDASGLQDYPTAEDVRGNLLPTLILCCN